MNTAQLAQAAKQDAWDKKYPYGFADFNGVQAQFTPTGSRTRLSNWKGRVNWSINGKAATKAQAQALLG